MWPKVFAQLVELLPHVSRLVPMADLFLQSRTANGQAAHERAGEAAITAMAAEMRSDLGRVASAHSSLYRQLQQQGVQIADAASDARMARASIEGFYGRMSVLEKKQDQFLTWLKIVTVLLGLLIALVIAVLIHVR